MSIVLKVSAQKLYTPGCIIKNTSDTTKVYIAINSDPNNTLDLMIPSGEYNKMKNPTQDESLSALSLPMFNITCTVYGGADYGYNNIRYSYYHNSFSMGKQLSPLIGGQFNLSIPRWIKSLSIQFDISATRTMVFDKTSSWFSSASFLCPIIHASIGPKYTFRSLRYNPGIQAGVGYSWLCSSNDNINKDYIIYIMNLSIHPSLSNGHSLMFGLGYEAQGSMLNTKGMSYEQIIVEKKQDIESANASILLKMGYTF